MKYEVRSEERKQRVFVCVSVYMQCVCVCIEQATILTMKKRKVKFHC